LPFDLGMYTRIEDGRRSVHDVEIFALAQALECKACWLLTGGEVDAEGVGDKGISKVSTF
jgi:hypothetical protein